MNELFEPVAGGNKIVCFSLFLITICNLKCSYCYARKTKPWGEILKKSDLDIIIKYLQKIKFKFKICLLGGEPTLYPNLECLIDKLDKIQNCITIEIFTNGLKYIDFKSKKIDLNMSWHAETKGFNKETFLKNYKKYNEKFPTTVCSIIDLKENIKYFKQIHYQNIIDKNISITHIKGEKEKDLFYFNGKIVTESYISKNNISFKGWNCDMYNFLIEKDYILDECNHKKYTFNEDLQITRKCTKENCFKYGDFLLYNKKYKN